MRQKILILLGPPGAGKGTQAIVLCDHFKIPHISTGDLFRANLKEQTPTGLQAKNYMERGDLPPDELVLEMLFDRLKAPDCEKGYLLDGFPRTLNQAEKLDERLGDDSLLAISIEVPDGVILERLTGRVSCEVCGTPYHLKFHPPSQPGICDRCGGKLIQRKDDTEEVVRNRLNVYHDQTEPVKGYYQKQGVLVTVDGNTTPEQTTTQLLSVIPIAD